MDDRFWPYPGATQPEAYERLNECSDPEHRLESHMWGISPLDGKVLLDIGAGSGYHAIRYAIRASHVYALEPDKRMRAQLYTRLLIQTPSNVSVFAKPAGDIPLADGSIDIAHARFAYFFGTDDCLPGMSEVKRVLRPGGDFFVIESNWARGEYNGIARLAYPDTFSEDRLRSVRAFFERHGFHEHVVDTSFRAPSREVLAQVMEMDFGRERVDAIMRSITGVELSYSLLLFHHRR